ncbi:MAG: hypothetical protein GY866_33325 [Proteobacteria bacterium]|nr:hypothetical protein [Pseudomonadota bacterium]
MRFKQFPTIKLVLTLFFMGTLSSTALAAGKAGIGFTFGTMFQQHQESTFKQGTASYFRLNFTADAESSFFLHSEQGAFNAEEGRGIAPSIKNSQGIGMTMGVTPDITMDILIGGATVTVATAGAAATGLVTGTSSTDPIAEIGVKWTKATGKSLLNVGLSYRQHKMGAPVIVTDAAGNIQSVNNLSSMNIGIDIGLSF